MAHFRSLLPSLPPASHVSRSNPPACVTIIPKLHTMPTPQRSSDQQQPLDQRARTAARKPLRLHPRWPFSPPTCRENSAPATRRSASSSDIRLRICWGAILLRSLPGRKKRTTKITRNCGETILSAISALGDYHCPLLARPKTGPSFPVQFCGHAPGLHAGGGLLLSWCRRRMPTGLPPSPVR